MLKSFKEIYAKAMFDVQERLRPHHLLKEIERNIQQRGPLARDWFGSDFYSYGKLGNLSVTVAAWPPTIFETAFVSINWILDRSYAQKIGAVRWLVGLLETSLMAVANLLSLLILMVFSCIWGLPRLWAWGYDTLAYLPEPQTPKASLS